MYSVSSSSGNFELEFRVSKYSNEFSVAQTWKRSLINPWTAASRVIKKKFAKKKYYFYVHKKKRVENRLCEPSDYQN